MDFQKLFFKLSKVCGCETGEEVDQFKSIKPLNDSYIYDQENKQWKKIINGIPEEIQKLNQKTPPPLLVGGSNLNNINTGVEQRNKYIDVFGNEKDSKPTLNLFVPKKQDEKEETQDLKITQLKND